MTTEATMAAPATAQKPPSRLPFNEEPPERRSPSDLGALSEDSDAGSQTSPENLESQRISDTAGAKLPNARLPLTHAAELKAQNIIELYREKLDVTAQSLAKRQQVDDVSEIHIEEASKELETPKSSHKHYASAISGIVAGASLSKLFEIVGIGGIPGLAFLALLILGIAGIAWDTRG